MRTRTPLFLAAVLLCGFAPLARAADALPEPPPDVAARLDSGTGKLTATGSPRGINVEVAGTNDAGSATLTFGRATPSRLTFHFANLRGMHSFTLTDGKNAYQGTFGWNGGKTHAYFDRAGRQVNNAALAAVSITMQSAKAGVEIAVSARGVELGKNLRVQWVQFNPNVDRFGFKDS